LSWLQNSWAWLWYTYYLGCGRLAEAIWLRWSCSEVCWW